MRQNDLVEALGYCLILSPFRNHLSCPLPEKICDSNTIFASEFRQDGKNRFMFGEACPFFELCELIRHKG